MKALEIKHIYKEYKLENKTKFQALNDISVSFNKGELVSIIGESGSGKSTLMNLIGGLDTDYDGEILIEGKSLKSFKDKQLDDYRKKKIGFVFQSFNLIPHLSILDNVTIPLTLSDVKESEKNEKAKIILKKLGLENQIKKKPTQLSGGQKQRVAIARALINDPDIILADEPTGSLDSQTTAQILEILKEIADEGKLVIMVTHSEKVASVSSRIVKIADGQIIEDKINQNYISSTKDLQIKEKQKENKEKKEKHLSFLSALKLSVHNMWASRTKNFLMALGVSISLVSMIFMLAFGAGLTNYINDLAQSYTNPKIVTVTKSSTGFMDFFTPQTFTEDDITQVTNDINDYLNNENIETEFRVNQSEIKFGYSTYIPSGQATIQVDENSEEINITSLTTTPYYYTEEQLLIGKISGNEETVSETGEKIGEVMFNSKIVGELGLENIEDTIGKTVIVKIKDYNIEKKMKITGIIDSSMTSQILAIYIDYDYLKSLTEEQGKILSPTSLYIETDSESTTNLINSYLNTSDKYSVSMENQMANMFSEMMSTFSIALAVIAGISLLVAMIMIMVVLYMSVSERTREIGVLKSIGARKKDIKKIFTTESFLVGLFSGIVGVICSGIVGAIFIIIFKALIGFAPLTFYWYYFATAIGLSVLISVLAGLYPASKAAKLDPVESLRHE